MTTRTYGWVVAIAALGLLLAYGCQYMVVRPARGSASAPECSAVSLLSAMRERLRPEADFSESGGIYLDSVDPEDPEALIAMQHWVVSARSQQDDAPMRGRPLPDGLPGSHPASSSGEG